MKVVFEHTDTFAGEPNYCWVHRSTQEVSDEISDRALVRRAKRFAGLTGLRCQVAVIGDLVEIRPYGRNEVVFVSFED